MKIPFTYYLHDEDFAESWDFTFKDTELEDVDPYDSELAQKIGRPFYEVTLRCELDTDTGEITLLRAKL